MSNSESETTRRRCDPVEALNEECVFHIYSFVVGDKLAAAVDDDYDNFNEKAKNGDNNNTQCLTVAQAGQIYYNFAGVSKGWRQVTNAVIANLVGPLEVDFSLFNSGEDKRSQCVAWLCRHKLRLSQLHCVNTCQCMTRLLKTCDTTKLQHVTFPLILCDEGEIRTQQKFQKVLAQECPNLQHIGVIMDNNWQNGISKSEYPFSINPMLFSCPTIQSLSVTLTKGHGPIHPEFFLQLTRHLVGLRHLTLSADYYTVDEDTYFYIQSNHLEKLDIKSFVAGTRFAFHCPNLRIFRMGASFGWWGQNLTKETIWEDLEKGHHRNKGASCIFLV